MKTIIGCDKGLDGKKQGAMMGITDAEKWMDLRLSSEAEEVGWTKERL